MDIYQCDNDDRCGGFEQDILVRRLIEKWWNSHLKAAELNDEAESYLHRDMHDEALKCCNQSLELGKFISIMRLQKYLLITN